MATDASTRDVANGDRARPTEDRLHIGAGEENPEDAVTLDIVDHGHIDYVHDLRQPWPFTTDCFDVVVGNHVVEHIERPLPVFEEACRVLRPGGYLTIRVPLGVDALADPTHRQVWTWRTPEAYTVDANPWQPGQAAGLAFEIESRNIDIWAHWGGRLARRYMQRVADASPAAAATLPGCSGELTVTFRRLKE